MKKTLRVRNIVQTKYPKRYSQVFFAANGQSVVTDHWKKHLQEDLLCVEDYRDNKSDDLNYIYLTQFGMLFGEEEIIDNKKGVFAFYVHGCPFKCHFCYQNDFYDSTPKKQVLIQKLVEFVAYKLEKDIPVEFVISTYNQSVAITCKRIKMLDPERKIVYKFSGILTSEQIEQLKDCVDIFVPDFKAITSECEKFHGLPSGFAKKTMSTLKQLLILNKTVIVRHLTTESFTGWDKELVAIENFLSELKKKGQIYFSILNQFFNTITRKIEFIEKIRIEQVLESSSTPLLISSEVAL